MQNNLIEKRKWLQKNINIDIYIWLQSRADFKIKKKSFMENFSSIDLGSTLLSIAIAGGFVAFGILILRVLYIGIIYLIDKFRGVG